MKKFIFGIIGVIIVGIVVVAIPKHKKEESAYLVTEKENVDSSVQTREDDSDRLGFGSPTMIPLIEDLFLLLNNCGDLILLLPTPILSAELYGMKSARKPCRIVLIRFILDQICQKHKRQTQC